MKKSRIFIFIAFIGTPFLALGQYGTRDDGFGNRIPLGPPNAQQQRPVVQQYYPRTNVVTSPRPSQTSIAPTQSPATGMVGRKPIIYSSMPGEGGRSCPVCDQMWTEFARNHPGKNPRDYFDIRNDPSRFRPSMEGGGLLVMKRALRMQ